jgi:hypothetical protein
MLFQLLKEAIQRYLTPQHVAAMVVIAGAHHKAPIRIPLRIRFAVCLRMYNDIP